jgi:peptidoglycan/xylan/chitin deacetylase (PgdA/CDA1 family)
MSITINSSLIAAGDFDYNSKDDGPDDRLWNGKKAAVVITYDDGLNVHLDNVLPELERLQLEATFYVYVGSVEFKSRLEDWRALSLKGHEIGNHSIYHPCANPLLINGQDNSSLPDIGQYSVCQIVDEVRLANEILNELDGQTQRTYAYPCGNKRIGDTLYSDFLHDDIIAARGISARGIDFNDYNLYDLGAFMYNNRTTVDMLISLIDKIIDRRQLIIFVFHGIGGGHDIDMGIKEHYQFLQYLKSREADVWITTLRDAVKYMQPVTD